MKIKRMYSENLYSYANMEFEFDKFPGGTTLLLGRNLDQKTSNGSGKSSILKSLYFGLYGEDVNGAVKASVLRRGSSIGWYIIVEFEDRGHNFKIERFEGRKDKHSSGKGLNFYIDDQLFNGEGPEDTQKIINQKIKITPRLFLSSIYSAQNSKSNFLLESDTNKKELLSELLDLQIYQKAFVHVKDEISVIEEKQKDKENKIEGINEQIKTLDDQVKQIIEKRDKFSIELKEEIKKEEIALAELILKMDKLRKGLSPKHNLLLVKSKIDVLKKERSKIDLEVSNESKIKVTLEKVTLNINQLENDIKSLNEDISNLEKENKELELFVFDLNHLNEAESQKENIDFFLKDIDLLKEKINLLNLRYQSEQNEQNQYNKELLVLEDKIKVLIESKDCPTCLRPYEKEHVEHIQKEANSLLEEKIKIENLIIECQEKSLITSSETNNLKAKIKEEFSLKDRQRKNQDLILKLNLLSEKFKLKEKEKEKNLERIKVKKEMILEKEEKLKKYQFNKTEVKKLDDELIPLKARLFGVNEELSLLNETLILAEVENNQIKQQTEDLKDITLQKERKEDNIKIIKEKKNPYGEMISSIEKKTEMLFEKTKQYKEQLNKETENLKYLKFWQVGFAPTGIRSFITDDVIDLLNRKTQENLNDLFDGAISVLFDPESKNKKGVVSNKISTNFFLNGKDTPRELLSGGEIRRAILATELALTDIAESRSGNKLNVRFLDEPFDGMDSNGQLQAFKLFARLSKDKDGFFVISHDENFQNMCPNVIYVIKKNEVSKIVDKTQYQKYNIETDEDISEQLAAGNSVNENTDKKSTLAEKLRELAKNNAKKE